MQEAGAAPADVEAAVEKLKVESKENHSKAGAYGGGRGRVGGGHCGREWRAAATAAAAAACGVLGGGHLRGRVGARAWGC